MWVDWTWPLEVPLSKAAEDKNAEMLVLQNREKQQKSPALQKECKESNRHIWNACTTAQQTAQARTGQHSTQHPAEWGGHPESSHCQTNSTARWECKRHEQTTVMGSQCCSRHHNHVHGHSEQTKKAGSQNEQTMPATETAAANTDGRGKTVWDKTWVRHQIYVSTSETVRELGVM